MENNEIMVTEEIKEIAETIVEPKNNGNFQLLLNTGVILVSGVILYKTWKLIKEARNEALTKKANEETDVIVDSEETDTE